MRHYLRLRFRLLVRLLREMGWWRLMAIGSMLVLAVGRALLLAAASQQLVWLVPLAVGALALSQHRHRSDTEFLQLSAPEFRSWFAVEYALLTLPVVLVLLGQGRVLPAVLAPLLAAMAALAPAAKASAERKPTRSLFRSVAFEWVAMGRRWWLSVGWVALLAVAIGTHRTATGPALAIVAWLLLLLETYGPAEPLMWLLPALHHPGAWLWNRIGWAWLYFGLTTAPLAFVMLRGPAGTGGTLGLLVWCAVVLAMLVMAKYAFYPHAKLSRLTQAGAVLVAMSILGSNPAYAALLTACFLGLILKSRQQLAHFRIVAEEADRE